MPKSPKKKKRKKKALTKKKGKRGRPSKFTKENCQTILQGVGLGAPEVMSPQAAGLDYSTDSKKCWSQCRR